MNSKKNKEWKKPKLTLSLPISETFSRNGSGMDGGSMATMLLT